MKIWLTAPYDGNGIEEIETLSDPVGDVFSYRSDTGICTSFDWYREGTTWHRTKEQALKQARWHRSERIREVTERAAHVAALPEIAE